MVLGGQIRLPGFCIGKIDRVVIAIAILITQTSEGMAEFMHDDR